MKKTKITGNIGRKAGIQDDPSGFVRKRESARFRTEKFLIESFKKNFKKGKRK